MQWPCGLLTFTRTVAYRAASFTAQQFAAFNLFVWENAALIATTARLYDGLDLFVSLIQAFARDALPKEANKGVLVTIQ